LSVKCLGESQFRSAEPEALGLAGPAVIGEQLWWAPYERAYSALSRGSA